jgi:hypothetical protein
MMGERQVDQAALFYEFSLERHVPLDHLLRTIDRFVDLEGIRADRPGHDDTLASSETFDSPTASA